MVTEEVPTTQRVRRKAARAAGPPKTQQVEREATAGAAETVVVAPKKTAHPAAASKTRPTVRPPRRRQPNRRVVGWVSLVAAVMVIAALTAGVTALVTQHRNARAEQAREQRFVDTATQTVVNMYSHTMDNIDEAVSRFVNGTSGPLRAKFGAENIEILKTIFRKTNSSSEAVITGAGLESIDSVSDNAAVLVAVRVTVADMDGVNKPSEPYRMRVIVHGTRRAG
ncbi:mammalian cell entry protein [Mycobacterium kiyosense]|uniref:Mammalian cell entry protein n=1 Tax=Mycobacterium kiyosense TaxID=2871094 RepID=A0A9P3UUR1_9MYCO|nr:mammalian cell entry protein [Mycobacterium kiyosense]GLB84823.1 mammalian cell entry protein [Mycobacterium kiyosense]GLB89946.1 mammalian cell entry protein [Mycobacterium kiyosense]GLB95916.1 mammalian cell entry protein [Mycobacterium kiyosense]GLC02752.1 mammalian cell entry protein [Mycobacterium kiyosense]